MFPHGSKSSCSSTLSTVIKQEEADDDDEINPAAKVEVKLQEPEQEEEKKEEVPTQSLLHMSDDEKNAGECSNRNEIEPELVELKYEVKEENWVDESEQNPNEIRINTPPVRLNRFKRVPLSLSDFGSDCPLPPSKNSNQYQNEKSSETNSNNKKNDSETNNRTINIVTGGISEIRVLSQERSCPKCGKTMSTQRSWLSHIKSCQKRVRQNQQKGIKSLSPNPIQLHKNLSKKQLVGSTTKTTIISTATTTTSSSSRTTRIGNLQAVFINGKTQFIPSAKEKEEKDCDLDGDRKCSQCDEKFPTLAQLKSHHQMIHKDQVQQQEFSCHLCDFKTNQSHLLTLHRPTHAKTARWRCSEPNCKYSSRMKRNLMYHKYFEHGKRGHLKVFTCSFCSHKTPQLHHLKRHENSVHKRIKKFSCPFTDICSFKSASQCYITKHIKNHSKLKRFSCPESECEYAAQTRKDLKSHVRTIHHEKMKSKMKRSIVQNPPPEFSSASAVIDQEKEPEHK